MENLKLNGYIPRLLFKIYINLKNRFDPQTPIKEEELLCFEICKKTIFTPNSKLTMAPLSNKRFIKSDENDMFIVIHNRIVSIINHVYSYNVYIEKDDVYEELIKTFDEELEKRREELENEIKSNIKHSLQNILNRLS